MLRFSCSSSLCYLWYSVNWWCLRLVADEESVSLEAKEKKVEVGATESLRFCLPRWRWIWLFWCCVESWWQWLLKCKEKELPAAYLSIFYPDSKRCDNDDPLREGKTRGRKGTMNDFTLNSVSCHHNFYKWFSCLTDAQSNSCRWFMSFPTMSCPACQEGSNKSMKNNRFTQQLKMTVVH